VDQETRHSKQKTSSTGPFSSDTSEEENTANNSEEMEVEETEQDAAEEEEMVTEMDTEQRIFLSREQLEENKTAVSIRLVIQASKSKNATFKDTSFFLAPVDDENLNSGATLLQLIRILNNKLVQHDVAKCELTPNLDGTHFFVHSSEQPQDSLCD